MTEWHQKPQAETLVRYIKKLSKVLPFVNANTGDHHAGTMQARHASILFHALYSFGLLCVLFSEMVRGSIR